MLRKIPHFIVIDDDYINNTLCRMLINSASEKRADINTFTNPEKGFEYIAVERSKYVNGYAAIILLDLNMPVMNGWELLDRFEELNEKIKERFKIYILSSSDDPRDRERAGSNKNVIDYIVKPLTKDVVKKIIGSNR
ncbi:MAG TPA: response regulator [Ignavibacteriaceae bacterium]|nr:response regulator [Ignavibacteriaceae bacterium]